MINEYMLILEKSLFNIDILRIFLEIDMIREEEIMMVLKDFLMFLIFIIFDIEMINSMLIKIILEI